MPQMIHPSLPGRLIDVASDKVARTYAARGWRPVERDDSAPVARAHTRAELDDLARSRGIDPEQYPRKKDLADALAAQPQE